LQTNYLVTFEKAAYQRAQSAHANESTIIELFMVSKSSHAVQKGRLSPPRIHSKPTKMVVWALK